MKNIEDILYPLLSSYKNSPQLLKTIIGGIYSKLPDGLIYGNRYAKYSQLIDNSKNLTNDEILNYQWKETENVLDAAFDSIPFYQQLYSDYGISRKQIQNFNDFKDLPIISKDLIWNNINQMLSPKYEKLKLKMNTGGSTGSPLEFYIQKGETRPKERAFLNSYFNSLGYNRGQRSAVFRGDKVTGNSLYMYDPIKANYIFSSYRIGPNTIAKIIRDLNKIKPKFIFGYPSVIYDLANYMDSDHNLVFNFPIEGVILASEKLFDFQIIQIEKLFKTKVHSYYGHSERLILAYKCRYCNNYLVDPLYGYAELIDINNTAINTTVTTKRIIATGFNNFVMPLIRYDTNDEATLSPKPCGLCKDHKTMLLGEIEGRKGDYIVGKDGRKISITAIIFGQHLNAFKKITHFQLVQNLPGLVDFNIVGDKILTSKEEIELKTIMQRSADFTIDVNVKYVSNLIRTSSNKFRYLIQNIGSNR